MKLFIKNIIFKIRSLVFGNTRPNKLFVKLDPNSKANKNEITERVKFFAKDLKIEFVNNLSIASYFNMNLISLNTNDARKSSILKLKKDEVYDLDYHTNYMDGWDYHRMLTRINREQTTDAIYLGQKTLKKLRKELGEKYAKAYILGTGPSLEKAGDVDWSDGIRVVSNTIVKDQELWGKINPHFIVAGDAIYHYGPSQFATSFRRDLKKRLIETDTYFVFPSIFYSFCLSELGLELKHRLIPVPIGSKKTVHESLTENYELPGVGNVLPLLLLPVACTMSRNINLWGFDGRSPNDKMFWKNSDKHFYNEHIDELKAMHPAFFDVLVPKGKQDEYVKSVHGEPLEHALSIAETNGFTFRMMHFSYTDTLMKRHV